MLYFPFLDSQSKTFCLDRGCFSGKEKKNQKKEMLLKHLLVENIRGTELSLNYWNAVVFFTVLVGEILLPVSVASFQGLKQKFNLFYLRRSEL